MTKTEDDTVVKESEAEAVGGDVVVRPCFENLDPMEVMVKTLLKRDRFNIAEITSVMVDDEDLVEHIIVSW